MNHIANARKLRPFLVKAAQSLDDKDASKAVALFDGMKYDGSLVKSGTKINWHGTIKKANVDLWDTEENNPVNAPSLWDDLAYRDGFRFIPIAFTAATMFNKGERGWWDDALYESLIDANVYTPSDYPAGWALVITT